MRRLAVLSLAMAALAAGGSAAMAQSTQTVNIPATTVPNDGAVHVLGTVSWAAISQVNTLAGQDVSGDVSGFTLLTDASPSTYPTVGTIGVNATDTFGNGYQLTVTYTGRSAQGFTGCTVTSGNVAGMTTSVGPAEPLITGSLALNRTGTGSHPWMNTLTSATAVTYTIQSSADGGQTWDDEASIDTVGGLETVKGQTVTVDGLSVGPVDPVAGRMRLTAVVTGPSSVYVTGTATLLTR